MWLVCIPELWWQAKQLSTKTSSWTRSIPSSSKIVFHLWSGDHASGSLGAQEWGCCNYQIVVRRCKWTVFTGFRHNRRHLHQCIYFYLYLYLYQKASLSVSSSFVFTRGILIFIRGLQNENINDDLAQTGGNLKSNVATTFLGFKQAFLGSTEKTAHSSNIQRKTLWLLWCKPRASPLVNSNSDKRHGVHLWFGGLIFGQRELLPTGVLFS